MSTDLELVTQPMSALDVRAQVNLIQEVMQSVMKDGTHYGKIPGAGDKPTLLKSGAEKLASTFRLAVDPVIEELSYGNEFRVRVIARITEMGSGRFLGAGVGECSSSESKYMWRAVVCQEEFDETPDTLRRTKWNKGYQNKPAWSQKQVRMNVADVANTVLKMAKKRAMVDGILTVTGASDIFTQDIEELPKEYLEQRVAPASIAPNPTIPIQSTSATDGTNSAMAGNSTQTGTTSAISHDDSEPVITPRSRRGAQPSTQPQSTQPAASQGPAQDLSGVFPKGEIQQPGQFEPPISKPQSNRYFAIMKSASVTDEQSARQLASLGYHGSRDEMPKRIYNDAIDLLDPQNRFHQNKP